MDFEHIQSRDCPTHSRCPTSRLSLAFSRRPSATRRLSSPLGSRCREQSDRSAPPWRRVDPSASPSNPKPTPGACAPHTDTTLWGHFPLPHFTSGLCRVPAQRSGSRASRGNFSRGAAIGRGSWGARDSAVGALAPGRAPWPGPVVGAAAAALCRAPSGGGWRAGAEERAGMASPPHGEMRALRDQVAALEADLAACRGQLERAQRRLRRTERLYREARDGSEALRRQVGPGALLRSVGCGGGW